MYERWLVGVDVGGTKTAVVAGTDAPRVVARESFATDPELGAADAIERIVGAIERVCSAAGALLPPGATAAAGRALEFGGVHAAHTSAGRAGAIDAAQAPQGTYAAHAAARVDAIGVSCGGPLDSSRGVILGPPNLPGWDDVPIVAELSRRIGLPVFLQNDANACALAEHRWGAGRGTRNMVFLTFGTGMGSGLILDGRLYAGTNEMAGEVGHLRLTEEGPVGYGKAGSFEGYASGGAIAQLARSAVAARLRAGEPVSFCASEEQAERLTARDVVCAAAAGDPVALGVIDVSATYLGRGIALLIDLLNPERIVIGSIFARAERLFRARVEQVVRDEALARSAAVCSIVSAALGEQIGDFASLCVAMEGIGEGPRAAAAATAATAATAAAVSGVRETRPMDSSRSIHDEGESDGAYH